MSSLPPGTTLLPASAGTGKTFRIVEMLLRLIVDEGYALDRLVVVTFTEAAAGELRGRIRQRLAMAREALQRDGGAEPASARLRGALTAFDTSCITTIHGFCARVLTEAAFEAGAPFVTELIGDAARVARDVVADFWLRHTWDAPPATLRSFQALGITRPTLLDLATKAMNPDLRVVPADPGRPEPVDLQRWRQLIDEARHAADDGSAQDRLVHSKQLIRRRNRSRGWLEALSVGRVAKLCRQLQAWLQDDPVPGRGLPEAVRELSSGFLEQITLPGGETPTHPLFDALQALRDEHAAIRPALDTWRLSLQHEVIREARRRIVEALRARNGLTFDEMLRRVRVPLTCPERGPALRAAIRRRYDAALVDEFQDTDPVQWDIFRHAFGDRLYLVGDPKQAIYSFRGADFNTYLRAERDCETAPSLDVNYRSDQALVDAVDRLFRRNAVQDPFFTAPIPFPEVSAHRHERGIIGDGSPPLQIRLLGREGRRLEHYRWLATRQLETDLPHVVANDIVRQLQRGDRLRTPSGERPIGPGDCAVLTRKNAQARAIAQALIQRGVPATTRSDASVLDSAAFHELRHVLHAVHRPLETHLVRRALLTELLGITAAELAHMVEDAEAWAEHAARFRRWRGVWEGSGVLALVRAILDEGGISARLLRQGRERRATDLRHLGELFQRVSSERRLSPTALLAWIEEGCPGLDDADVGLRLETDAEAVQCVTVHSAKGLEYALVWAPWLHSGSWVAQRDKDHLVIPDPHEPDTRRLDLGSPDKEALLRARSDASIAEDLRLIYVALTRARHRIVLYHGASGEDAALAWLIHQRDWMHADREERWKQVQNRFYFDENQGERNLVEDLEALSKSGHIAWSPVDWADAEAIVRWEPARGPTRDLRAATLSRLLPPDLSWGSTSFTGLTRQVHALEPRPEIDHDERAAADPASPAGELPMAEVTGGARLGIAVHEVLERHDFTAGKEALEAHIRSSLGRHGLLPEWVTPITTQLDRALRSPILEGLRLADLEREERWDELHFSLPVRGDGSRFDVGDLRQAFAFEGVDPAWREVLERLDFAPVHGFLIGSIDLVFQHEGRWFLADYKSNRLGPERGDYAPGALSPRMNDAFYPLQYHLYCVALIRLLRARIPGFQVERDFGGALYLFLRGMDPAHPGHGVFYDRPSPGLLERLDRAIGGAS